MSLWASEKLYEFSNNICIRPYIQIIVRSRLNQRVYKKKNQFQPTWIVIHFEITPFSHTWWNPTWNIHHEMRRTMYNFVYMYVMLIDIKKGEDCRLMGIHQFAYICAWHTHCGYICPGVKILRVYFINIPDNLMQTGLPVYQPT